MSINAAVISAVANLETVIASVGTLQNAPQSTLAPILNAVASALSAIDTQCAAIEATIDETSVGGIHVGTPAPQMILTLVAQTQGATDLSNLHTLRGYVSRIGANIQNTPG
jgi:hypothetical protein